MSDCTVSFDPVTREKIEEALISILEGKSKRVEIEGGVKVYECQNVIRIDLKIQKDG